VKAISPGLRILELGDMSLLKSCFPNQSTFIFTGAGSQAPPPGIAYRPFSPATFVEILRGLHRRDWDLIFCYPPATPLWDCRRGAVGALSSLSRMIFRFRTLGAYAGRVGGIPLVVIDLNDTRRVPAPCLPLLDRSVLYFKRELPLDPAKSLFDVTPQFRSHDRVMTSRFYERNRSKLKPVSASVPDAIAEMAQSIRSEKSVDVFFAGSLNSEIRRRGFEELRLLSERGIVVDVSSGGLSRREYLQRCARSWLTWSPEGYGWECFRHYEASLCGSVPILNAPSITRYAPLEDGVHAIMYPDRPGGLVQTVETALSQKPALASIADSARLHALSHHTHGRICEHIVGLSLDLVRHPLSAG
jgi:hypothetical protein